MAEEYKLLWGEIPKIKQAIALVEKIITEVQHGHIESKDFDVDITTAGIRITIPHDPVLTEERKEL